MKMAHLFPIGSIVLVAGVLLFSQERESELNRVARQVEALRKEVSYLSNQVELLRREFAILRSQELAPAPGVPFGSTPHEINGVKFYLVPVHEAAEAESP